MIGEMAMITIKIAKDFSRFPAGRYLSDGEFSGERFREQILVPNLRDAGEIEIDIDDAAGYGSSFLEEAFGGLVRKGYFTPADLRKRLMIISKDPGFSSYKGQIWRFIDSAK